jgi:outer membrane protein assembly factor BamB
VPGATLKTKLLTLIGALVVIGVVIGGGLYYAFPVQISIMGALSRNFLITWSAPSGTATTESNANYKVAGAVAPAPSADATAAASGDWPSYNRTLNSDRYSPLSQINTKNVEKLKVVLFGDVGGNFYALDAANGQKLWGKDLGGAVGGGVITQTVAGAQKIAAAIGFTHPVWPTKIVTAKIVVLGLDSASAKQ